MSSILSRFQAWTVGFVWGPEASADPAVLQHQRRVVAGVAAVSLLVILFGLLHAVGTTPFAPPDETSHVAYALAVSDWRIPHIAEFPSEHPIPGMNTGLSVWTANHPPLTYVLMAVPLRLGIAIGYPLAGFLLARMLNVFAVALTMFVIARIATALLGDRPRVIVMATAISGLTPFFLHVGATAYTDGLALLPTVGIVAVAVDALVHGPTRPRLWWMVGLAAVCSLTRSQSLVAVFFAGSGWGLAELIHGRARLWARVRRGVAGAALVGGVAVAAGAWFYLGNVELYGDPSGSQALFELHSRQPRGTFWGHVTSWIQLRYQHLLLWSGTEGLPGGDSYFVIPGEFVASVQPYAVIALFSIGGVVASHWGRTRGRFSMPKVVAFVLLGTWLVTLYSLMEAFTAAGGSPHSRYYWSAWFVGAIALAVGLDSWRLPPWRRVFGGGFPIGGFVALGLLLWAQVRGWPRALELFGATTGDQSWPGAVIESFQTRQIPAAGSLAVVVMVSILVVIAILATVLVLLPGGVATEATPPGNRGRLDVADAESAPGDGHEEQEGEAGGEDPVGAVH